MAGARESAARAAAACGLGGESTTRATGVAGGGAVPSLEDAVLLRLANPALGCVVCGGPARRRQGGVACLECGSALSWGAASGV
jgi:hypothetical protein